SVISGHSGLTERKLFTDLEKLVIGDDFYLTIAGEKLAYAVDDIQIVLPSDIDKVVIQPGRDLVTLLTCTPYGINTHRLLVTGHRVPYVEEM
ncbi:sortase, partial [Vibrio parahaemolyticus]|nr:sortase [Vibrio parahaemolyticus]